MKNKTPSLPKARWLILCIAACLVLAAALALPRISGGEEEPSYGEPAGGNDGRYFDASEPWYRNCERHLAETIIRSGCIAEVNCAGLRIPHREAAYPSENILTMLYESGVPVMLTADAHRPEHLVAGYDKARELLRKIGFTSTVVLHGGRFVEQEL